MTQEKYTQDQIYDDLLIYDLDDKIKINTQLNFDDFHNKMFSSNVEMVWDNSEKILFFTMVKDYIICLSHTEETIKLFDIFINIQRPLDILWANYLLCDYVGFTSYDGFIGMLEELNNCYEYDPEGYRRMINDVLNEDNKYQPIDYFE